MKAGTLFNLTDIFGNKADFRVCYHCGHLVLNAQLKFNHFGKEEWLCWPCITFINIAKDQKVRE